jgi:RNA recognition motif-containing protein
MRLQYFRGNLFVANLPPNLTEDELAEAFDPFGIVLSAFIARDPETGRPLRYGFVDIATERAAKLAGHNLDVRISERPHKVRQRPTATPTSRRAPLHNAPRRAAIEGPAEGFSASPPRRPPTFQVERRSLPRRV